MRCSNCFFSMLNFVTLVASLIIILMAMSFNLNSNASVCQKTLQKPLLIVGVVLMVLSLMGIIGASCHVSFLLWIYLFLLFVLIIAMMIYSIISVVISLRHGDNNPSDPNHNKGELEKTFHEYSQWFEKHLPDEKDWDKIKSCMVDAKYCSYVPKDRTEEFYKTKMNNIQSGCCKPPTYCNMQFQNGTVWNMPKSGAAVPDSDCKTWNNDQNQLCYSCNSCKKAVLDDIKKYYKHSSLISFIVFVIISIVYSIGCCALTNNSYRKRAYAYHGYSPYGPPPPGPYGYRP